MLRAANLAGGTLPQAHGSVHTGRRTRAGLLKAEMATRFSGRTMSRQRLIPTAEELDVSLDAPPLPNEEEEEETHGASDAGASGRAG